MTKAVVPQQEGVIGSEIATSNLISLPADNLHTYIIGVTGAGKTTLEHALIHQNILAGHGVCVIDPHAQRSGCLTDLVLAGLPQEREKDVIIFDINTPSLVAGLRLFYCSDPTDPIAVQTTTSQAFNIFQKVYDIDRLNPQISQYLQYLIHLFIHNPDLTLLDIPRLYKIDRKEDHGLHHAFRSYCVSHLPDDPGYDYTRDFWLNYFLERNPSRRNDEISATINKFREVTNPLVWAIFCQKTNTIDIEQVMAERKILLIRLNANFEDVTSLVGSVLIGQIKNASANRSLADPPFYLYVDEFKYLATKDFNTLFSESRGGNLHITVAHQVMTQLDESIKETVRQASAFICFKITDISAEQISGMFDTKPPDGQWIYEKQMRRVERTEPQWYWEPPEMEAVYQEVATRRNAVSEKLQSGTSPIPYQMFHTMLSERMYKKRFREHPCSFCYQSYVEYKRYEYAGFCDYLREEDEALVGIYHYYDEFKGLTDTECKRRMEAYAWNYFKLLCFRCPTPIPGVPRHDQLRIKRLMKDFAALSQQAQTIEKAHHIYGSITVDAGWYEPIPVMEQEYRQLAREFGENPSVGDNVRYSARLGPAPYGSDEVARRIANEIKRLPDHTARIRLKSGEFTIETIPPAFDIHDAIVQKTLTERIQTIQEQNKQDGYLRLRSEVVQEIRKRNQPPVQPAPTRKSPTDGAGRVDQPAQPGQPKPRLEDLAGPVPSSPLPQKMGNRAKTTRKTVQ